MVTKHVANGKFTAGLMLGVGVTEIAYSEPAGYILVGGAIGLVYLMVRDESE